MTDALLTELRELYAAAKHISPYLKTSYDAEYTLAVNIPPAMAMRKAADALEKKDRDIEIFRALMRRLEERDWRE